MGRLSLLVFVSYACKSWCSYSCTPCLYVQYLDPLSQPPTPLSLVHQVARPSPSLHDSAASLSHWQSHTYVQFTGNTCLQSVHVHSLLTTDIYKMYTPIAWWSHTTPLPWGSRTSSHWRRWGRGRSCVSVAGGGLGSGCGSLRASSAEDGEHCAQAQCPTVCGLPWTEVEGTEHFNIWRSPVVQSLKNSKGVHVV